MNEPLTVEHLIFAAPFPLAANRGAAYEIAQIVDLFPLSRVVFAVDETTDRRAMEASFEEAWRSVGTESPNAGRRVEPRVCESTDDPRGLIAELAGVRGRGNVTATA